MITNESATALSIFPWGRCRPIKDCESHLICAISIRDISPLRAKKKGERETETERQAGRHRQIERLPNYLVFVNLISL